MTQNAYIEIAPRIDAAAHRAHPSHPTSRYEPTRITDWHGALIATPQTWRATVTHLWGRTRCVIWTGTAREPKTGRMLRWSYHETDNGGTICRIRPA